MSDISNMNDLGKISFRLCGNYDESITYERLDVVTYGGSSYVALKSTTGNTPSVDSTFWQLIASGSESVGGSGIIISEVEPTDQDEGDFWLQEYTI